MITYSDSSWRHRNFHSSTNMPNLKAFFSGILIAWQVMLQLQADAWLARQFKNHWLEIRHVGTWMKGLFMRNLNLESSLNFKLGWPCRLVMKELTFHHWYSRRWSVVFRCLTSHAPAASMWLARQRKTTDHRPGMLVPEKWISVLIGLTLLSTYVHRSLYDCTVAGCLLQVPKTKGSKGCTLYMLIKQSTMWYRCCFSEADLTISGQVA